MRNKNDKEQLVKAKAEYIKNHDFELYTMLSNYKLAETTNIYEVLTSILLSNKQLEMCPRYKELNEKINTLNFSQFKRVENENYSLKVIFIISRYLNNSVKPNDKIELRNRIRVYTKYMDGHMFNQNEVSFCEEEKSFIKKLK